MKVDVVVLPSGEWYGYPQDGGWHTFKSLERLRQLHREGHATPEAAGLKRTGEWRTMGWPEDSKEAEYEL